jgi:GT2 family glycosyltransferase
MMAAFSAKHTGCRATAPDGDEKAMPQKQEQVSLIIVMYNEKATVSSFFEVLETFTRLPDEIVMLDGGSTDGTVEITREHMKSTSVPVNLIVRPQCNIPRSRNIAIENARYDILAATDMGCIVTSEWLERILAPFGEDPTVDAVGGYYEPLREGPLQEAYHHLTWKENLEEGRFLPSHRSVAFRRKVWEGVGRYPEHLQSGEDTLFDLRILEKGFRLVNAPAAKVYWEVKKSYKQFFILYFRYARGDGLALIQVPAFLFLSGNYFLFFLWLGLSAAVSPFFLAAALAQALFYGGFRIFRKPLVRKAWTPALLPRYIWLTLCLDTGRIAGYCYGMLRRLAGAEDGWLPAREREEASRPGTEDGD